MNKERSAYIGCFYSIVGIVLLLIAALMFGSCRSVKYVPVVEHHTDSLCITQHTRDSIYLRDSIHIREKGDTVTIEKWRTQFVSREVHDTIYIATHDTIPQPYPVTVEVPAQLSWWQQARLHLANAILWALLIVCAYWLIRKKTSIS